VYLADTGNVLIPEHILPWISSLAVYGFHGPYFFAPVAANLNGILSWISANESLIGNMENKTGDV
jgi:hypothetical protein